MATLPRPGVEISQEIVTESPTVLTPALVPCIVGACFQIVNPIDDDGALNPQASVSIAARAVSTADLTEPLALRGREFTLTINGNPQTITMPAAVGGDFDMSFALIVNTLNAGLTGAIAEISPGVVDGVAQPSRLIIRTTNKGPTASIVLTTNAVPGNSAHGAGGDDIVQMNALEGLNIAGQTNYTNIAYDIPYTSLPSPMADADDCVWAGADITLYRFFANSLYELSTDSACGWNKFTKNITLTGLGAPVSNGHMPAVSAGSSVLWARSTGAGKTNRLCNLGSDASAVIPLAHTSSAQYTGVNPSVVAWPDVGGSNSLTVTANGLATYAATGNPADIGPHIGFAGNLITVVFANGATMASWAPNVLTIQMTDATTFAELETALSDPALISSINGEVSINLQFDPADAASPCRGFAPGDSPAPWAAGAAVFNLTGGTDPVDFTLNGDPGAPSGDERQAWVCGATEVGASTATQLGIGGEILNISIDGGAPIEVTLAGGTPVTVSIDNALGALGTCAPTTIPNALGELGNPIQINTASTLGHDSTISLSASNSLVIERLLTGSKTETESVPNVSAANPGAFAGVGQGRYCEIQGGAEYNMLAMSRNQLSIVPGTLSCTLDGIAIPTIRTACTEAQIASQNGGGTWSDGGALVITVEGALSQTLTLDLATGNGGGPFLLLADLAAEINSQIQAGALAFLVISYEADGALCFSRLDLTTGLATTNSSLLVANNAGGTDQDLEDAMGLPALSITASEEPCSITIDDQGANNSLRVTGCTSTLAQACPVPLAAPTTIGTLTEYFLGGSTLGAMLNRGIDDCLVDYSTGTVGICTAGDSLSGVPTGAFATTFATTTISPMVITYTKVWPSIYGPSPDTYTSRVFHGRSNQVMTGDTVWNNGSVQGRVVGIEGWSLDALTFPGAQLVISEFAVTGGTSLTDWYVQAENLIAGAGDDAGGNIRPEPEAAFSDLMQVYSIKPNVNRNSAGIAIANSTAPVYAQIKALRKDVSADTANPGLLVFSGIQEVIDLVGPIDPDNPLAMGLFQAFLNTTNISVAGLGVGDVSADAPQGTLEAYSTALDFLELHEVYSLAPMTHDMEVFKKFNLHVSSMSEPAGKKERMVLCCPTLPTEEASTLVGSADFMITDIGGGKFELTIADEAAAAAFNIPMAINGLLNAGGSSLAGGNGMSYLPSDGLYIDRAGDAFRYLIVGTPSADTVTIETSDVFIPGEFGPATGGNDDSYYNVGSGALSSLSTFEADGELCTIKVRQAAVDTSTTAGKLKACETLAEIAGGPSGFQNRRMVMVQPESVGATVDGLEVLVPGYYLCAGIAGMVGQQNPSQPFTNLPMVGYTRPSGSSDIFSENQMATAAAGGIYWVIQDSPGAPLVSRHQLTTDVSSLKTRELSILKAVDYTAKMIRSMVRRYIGRNNITIQLLETISLSIQAALNRVAGSVVAEATLDALSQSSDSPDEILATVSLVPYYPANRIKITIVI